MEEEILALKPAFQALVNNSDTPQQRSLILRAVERYVDTNPGKTSKDFKQLVSQLTDVTGLPRFKPSQRKGEPTKMKIPSAKSVQKEKARRSSNKYGTESEFNQLKQQNFSESNLTYSDWKKHVDKVDRRAVKIAKFYSEVTGTPFDAGHIQSLGVGGSPTSFVSEYRSFNTSKQQSQDYDVENVRKIGVPATREEAIIEFGSQSQTRPPLTEKTKSRVLGGNISEEAAQNLIQKDVQRAKVDEFLGRRSERLGTQRATPTFAKEVLQGRNAALAQTALTSSILQKAQQIQPDLNTLRRTATAAAVGGAALPAFLGSAASASELATRKAIQAQTGSAIDKLQTGIAGASLAADTASYVPVLAVPAGIASAGLDIVNTGIDVSRNLIEEAKKNQLLQNIYNTFR